jgi:hypothetical protein
MPPSDSASREIFGDLPWRAQDTVRQWINLGYPLRAALIESGALTNELLTPKEARHRDLRINRQRQSAEHEAAHAVAAHALGLKVHHTKVREDGSGECSHAPGTKLQDAIVLMAPEIWINQFRRDQFPYGAEGLKLDHEALAEIGNVLILREAMTHCVEILKQNSAELLATASKIEKYGYLVPW